MYILGVRANLTDINCELNVDRFYNTVIFDIRDVYTLLKKSSVTPRKFEKKFQQAVIRLQIIYHWKEY